jgi:hypothetical protein
LRDNEGVTEGPLSRVRWIGGGSGAGKSALAEVLADRLDLEVYDSDAAMARHALAPGADTPLLAAFLGQSADERWLRTPEAMLDTFPWFAGERFERVISDLEALSGSTPILAEGFRLLPRLVAPLLDRSWQGVWLVPTPEFRRTVFEERAPDRQFWLNTSQPRVALDRLLRRDAMFADVVAEEARELGLTAVTVDGSRSMSDLADELAVILRP